jgi:putative methionine-R-sulfoxide reductase with GAF domain
VDCFDALVSERPYRNAMPLDEAMAFMKSKAGSQFDPAIVRLLEEHYPRLERQARETTGEMTELDTDLRIERGAAPGAGFAQEGGAETQGSQVNVIDQEAGAIRSLREKLIAAGSRQTGFAFLSQHLMLLVPCDYLAVYLKSGDFIVARYFDGNCDPAFSAHPIPVGEGLSGWVAEHARSIVNGNPTVETNFVAGGGFFTPESSALSVPLAGLDGDVAGVLTLYARESAAFSNDHLLIVEQMAPKFAHELTDQAANEPMDTDEATAQAEPRSAGI